MNSFAIRGILEGFYGRPWSFAERERMVDFMGRHGYNLYVYAPKNDPLHRNRWREPYLPEELERFGALARRCEQNGIDFVFGISPLQYFYTSEEYFDILWQKVMSVYERGIRSFTILLDDMPDKFHHTEDEAKFKTIAEAQVWLNNTVMEKLESLSGVRKMLFCPTEYNGDGRSPYLEALGAGMRPEIEIFWTGTEVCAQYLRTEDARVISETLKRPVLYWDNYPVNDLDMKWRPHIRPVRGRDADLGTVAKGIVANAGLQPEANKIPLHTYAQYMADPVKYEPEAAWQKALLEVTGNADDAEAVAILGDMTRWSALERGKQLHNQLAFHMAEFWARWGGVPEVAGPDLPDAPKHEVQPPAGAGTREEREAALAAITAEFEKRHAAAGRILDGMANESLAEELRPWAEKLQGWTETGLLALQALNRSLAAPGDAETAALRNGALDSLWETRENFHWVSGDLIDQFSRRCLWAATKLQTGAFL